MIKINLLPARKPKRQKEPGQLEVAVGVGVLLAIAAVVYLTAHRSVAEEKEAFRADADAIVADNNAKRAKLVDMPTREAAFRTEEARNSAIKQLVGTIVVPDGVLHELGEILTPGRMPSMTKLMTERISDGPRGDPNRRFALDWDPKHVWITSFNLKGENFTLEGGAQGESDIPQLAKRMQASVFFDEVTSPSSSRVEDKQVSLVFYKFTITGKVVY